MRSRNFQLFFAGQSISVIGTWMTRIATSWLVYRLTQSALLLGIVSFASQIVSFFLGPFAGVWVERLNRRKLLTWVQVANAIESLVLAALTLAHRINLWEIIVLSALQGLLNALEMPTRQSFLVEIIDDRADLGNAIALNSTINSGARLIGPAIAGAVIAAVGEGYCFLADGISYLAVILSLFLMHVAREVPMPHRPSLFEQMREGWDYIRHSDPIRTVLIFFALSSLLGYPSLVLLPIFATQVLHGNAHTLGWLSAAGGLGTLTAAFSLAARKSITGLPRALQISAAITSVSLVLFGLSHWLVLSLVLMTGVGYGLMQCASGANTIIQSLVGEQMRARTMSYYTMAFYGTAPVGSLLAGALAHWIGAPRTVVLTGACCIAASLWFTLHLPRIRAALQTNLQKEISR